MKLNQKKYGSLPAGIVSCRYVPFHARPAAAVSSQSVSGTVACVSMFIVSRSWWSPASPRGSSSEGS
jgi:hypothetical protein